jgi:type I restriction enzyme R subunit
MSNFNFIPAEFQALAQAPIEAEKHVYGAPLYCAMLCRKSLEEWVRWMYEHDADLEFPYDTSLNSLMHDNAFKAIVAPSQFQQINMVRKLGNNAVHGASKIPAQDALHALQLLHGFIAWVVRVYGLGMPEAAVFDESILPKESNSEKTKKELQALENAFQEQLQKLKKAEEELAAIKAIKEQNIQHVLPPIDPNEEHTRKIYIDTLLNEAGWDVSAPNVIEYEVKNCMPQDNGKENGTGYVDYVLWGDDGKPLAVVEAKRTKRDARVGAHQAKCYADCLQKEFGQRPVIFYSSGYKTYLWDDTNYPPREVYGFYTKDELQLMIQRRIFKKPLASQTINNNITDRYYQQEAIRKVGETFEKQQRDALLVMATGTGKTRVAASIIDLLSKANWAKRILFLADRNALIHQAKVNLNDYLPNLPAVDLTKEKEDESSRIVFSTYQTIINMIDGERDGDQRVYGVGHFDLIIFDEIHRSVYNRYKAIFEYFDGLRIGLTATPVTQMHRDTYALFHLESNNPTYAYELEQAVNDNFLVPPTAIGVPTKFQRQGVKYAELSEAEKEQYEQEFTDQITGEMPEEIDAAALNKWLFNIDTVDKVISYLMENGIKVESGEKLAKTIIFAKSHDHAKFIEARFNLQYPAYKGEFMKVIDYHEEYRYDLLNKFKDKQKMPQIAVSVDMLDTGIDVPEVCNLVFYKPVKSSAKFWQMIGRGTRLCENLFDIDEHKKEFIIFDLCENFEFFGENPKGFAGNNSMSLSQRLFMLRLRLAFVLMQQEDSDLKVYANALITHLVAQTKELNTNEFVVRQHWQHVEKYQDSHAWNALSDLDIKEIFDHIAPLVKEQSEDEMAKRFDAMMLDMQLFTLQGDKRQVKIMQQVISSAGKLTKKASIPSVGNKLELLRQVQEKTYWDDIDILGMERIRVELRDIMKFLEKEKQPIVYSNFEDEIGSVVNEHQVVYGYNDLEVYKRKVENFFKENANHVVIQKLKTNQQITKAELQELEKMFFNQGSIGNKEDFVYAYGEQPLGKFIRSLMGLDVNAAKLAFGTMLNNKTLTSQQIRFLDTIINFFTVKGIVEPSMLFEPPFTDINAGGISSVFDIETTSRILAVIENVNHNADAA